MTARRKAESVKDLRKRYRAAGYALLAVPHNDPYWDATYGPRIIALRINEERAQQVLFDYTLESGDQFFYWLTPIEYRFFS